MWHCVLWHLVMHKAMRCILTALVAAADATTGVTEPLTHHAVGGGSSSVHARAAYAVTGNYICNFNFYTMYTKYIYNSH